LFRRVSSNYLALLLMRFLRGLVLLLLSLPCFARRSIRIGNLHNGEQQQSNTLASGHEVSAESQEILHPGSLGTGLFRLVDPRAGALSEGSKRHDRRDGHFEPRRVAPQFRSGLHRSQVARNASQGPLRQFSADKLKRDDVMHTPRSLVLSPVPGGRALPQTRRAEVVRCQMTDLPSGWTEVMDPKTGKPYYYNALTGVTQWQRPQRQPFDTAGDGGKRTLTSVTVWRAKLDLLPPGATAPVTISAKLRFVEDKGFEPPQGLLYVESCMPEGALGMEPTRWELSEDPEDRKDSLWIWGLFSDPLYPFCIFTLELAAPIAAPGNVSVPAGRLYFQVDHRRKDGSAQLGEGGVTYKVTQQLNADIVGLSSFNYGDPVPCGKIRFLDTAEDMSKSVISFS